MSSIALFTPVAYLSDLTRIRPRALAEEGYIAALIDIDNTLVPRDTRILSEEIVSWVTELKEAGLKVCLLSNNWHRTVFAYARHLEVPLVYKAMKPLPFSYLRALRKLGLRRMTRAKRDGFVARNPGGDALREGPEEGIGRVVVIGDQLLTDVLGARLLGLHPLLVEPQSTTDLWYTQLFRRIERVLLDGLRPS
jgi:predicted HAD superfamily phosphohydrolase YqeG